MDSQVKERIVGAAVLVALGVWLIPWVLDGPDGATAPVDPLSSLVPSSADSTAPIRTETVELAPRPTDQEAVDAVKSVSTEPSTVAVLAPEVRRQSVSASPRPPKPRSPDGWSVQVGAFSDIANADQLVSRVSTYGYSASISEFRSGDDTMYRVRVRSLGNEGDAEAAASSLAAHGMPVQVIPPE